MESETESKCCLCRQKWTVYRGKFKCCKSLCGVPVIVCDTCRSRAIQEPQSLRCELCMIGYRAPKAAPDLVGLKRKAESQLRRDDSIDDDDDENSVNKSKPVHTVQDRLFLGRLPLTVTKSKIAEALGGQVKLVHWMTDRNTGAFYGSCLVQLAAADIAKAAVDRTIKVDNKKIKVALARTKEGEIWPPSNYVNREYPPVGR